MGGKRTADTIGFRRLCTVKEIALASGLGVGTVHRVLKSQTVSVEVTNRVLATIEQLNSMAINAASRSQREERSRGRGLESQHLSERS
jgi:DNA-binding LacI/PurR family transcriptional regulator